MYEKHTGCDCGKEKPWRLKSPLKEKGLAVGYW